MQVRELLTFPDPGSMVLSIRAKALLFHDPRSVELLQKVERISVTDATVLVIGETGTGKELIARHIHKGSGRKGPFIAVNCGAFSENLIDAELFGHETGAFTGASQARSGWFEAANGGTLFLDEIGDLPLALQVKLLRVLQERQVVRLGSRRPIPLDVRLVAATNIDLHKAVAAQ
ncbi:MAG: Fis family transcriptional regulator, partial [Rhizobacter sp.]|nr:Fis family transcriptional regulator [Rhizobacter sp.]